MGRVRLITKFTAEDETMEGTRDPFAESDEEVVEEKKPDRWDESEEEESKDSKGKDSKYSNLPSID